VIKQQSQQQLSHPPAHSPEQPEAQLVQMSAQQAPTVTSIPAARISITDSHRITDHMKSTIT